jgi:allantoinase
MADRPPLDLLIKNVRFVRPGHHPVETRDLGIADGRFTRVEPAIDAALARAVFDARGRYIASPDSAPGASSP